MSNYIENYHMRKLRKSKGITQQQLAKKSEISQVYISKLEHGEVNGLNLLKIKKLSKALDMCPCELLRVLIKCELKYKGKCKMQKWG